MSCLVTTLAAQGPNCVGKLNHGMGAPNVMQFGHTTVFHVLALARSTVQVIDGNHCAFRGGNEASDLGDHCVQMPGVLRQTTAKDC